MSPGNVIMDMAGDSRGMSFKAHVTSRHLILFLPLSSQIASGDAKCSPCRILVLCVLGLSGGLFDYAISV